LIKNYLWFNVCWQFLRFLNKYLVNKTICLWKRLYFLRIKKSIRIWQLKVNIWNLKRQKWLKLEGLSWNRRNSFSRIKFLFDFLEIIGFDFSNLTSFIKYWFRSRIFLQVLNIFAKKKYRPFFSAFLRYRSPQVYYYISNSGWRT
jgi:hypothetical protein